MAAFHIKNDPGAVEVTLIENQGCSITEAAQDSATERFESASKGLRGLHRKRGTNNAYLIVHEDFVADPVTHPDWILALLNLENNSEFLQKAADLINASRRKGRHRVTWNPSQIDRIQNLIETYRLLPAYRGHSPGIRAKG